MLEKSAGGVVIREVEDELELLLIEDQYGYWTFPKGKQEAGETDEETAIREISEETGINSEVVSSLCIVKYNYRDIKRGMIQKEVQFFLMRAISGKTVPQLSEISKVKWFPLYEALKLIEKEGYRNQQELLQQLKNLFLKENAHG